MNPLDDNLGTEPDFYDLVTEKAKQKRKLLALVKGEEARDEADHEPAQTPRFKHLNDDAAIAEIVQEWNR